MGNQTTTITVGNSFQHLTGWPAKQVRVSNASDATVLVRRGTATFHAAIAPGSFEVFPVQITAAELALKRETAGDDVAVTVTYGDVVTAAPDVTEPGGGGGGGGGPTLSNDPAADLGTTAAAGNSAQASRANHVHKWPRASVDVTNAEGDETIIVPQGIRDYEVEATIEGDPGTRRIAISRSNRQETDRVNVGITLPATDGIIVRVKDNTVGGNDLVAAPYVQATSDGIRRVVVKLKFKGGVWIRDQLTDPA